MKININEAWKEMDGEFDVNKTFHFFALANLVRYTIEKESIKNNIDEIEYSIMHKFLHIKSVDSDYITTIQSLINILIKLPNNYPVENIINKLVISIEKSDIDYFEINQKPSKVEPQTYKIKLNSISIFTYSPLAYIYTGKKWDKSTITFISDKRLDLYNVYKLNVGYCKINGNTSVFHEVSSINFSRKIKENILNEYNIKNPNELFHFLEGARWPAHYDRIQERKIISDIASCFSNPFSRIEEFKKWKPFFDRPYINKTPSGLSIHHIKKIIKSYGKINNNWLNQYELKKNLDLKNIPYITKYDIDEKDFKWFIEDNNKLYYDEYFYDLKRFEKLFVEIDDNEIFSKEKSTKAAIINKLKNNRTVVLTGPAGHGKSYTIKNIAKFYKEKERNVKLLCPTWKSIEIYENEIENSTIKGLENKEEFLKNIDLLIIDEMSLISDWKFIESIEENTRIIIAGDRNQLPPIESKNKKCEWLINIANNSVIDLTKEKNWRIENAENKDIGKIQKYLINENFKHRIPNNGIKYLDSIKYIIEELISLSKKGYMIITSKNGGLLGADFLNRLLRQKQESEYSIGDKIIFTKNKKEKGYYNGLFGIVKKVDGIEILISTDNGKEINIKNIYNEFQSPPISHAYAINAHKAQGSTIEKVVVVVSGRTCYDWLYTAYSRASIDAKIIFKKNDFELTKRRI